MFCGGLPTAKGMPRIACPLERSTLVIGSDKGGGFEHAAVVVLMCMSCSNKHMIARLSMVKYVTGQCDVRMRGTGEAWSEL
jgi:hypothetical protein